MSKKGDFLSGFSGGNTQKPLTEQNSKPVKEEAKPPEKEAKKDTKDIPSKANTDTPKKPDLAGNKKLADKIVADAEKKDNVAKPAQRTASGAATRPAQSANAIIKAPEHVVTTDTTFHKRKMAKYGILGGVAIVVALIGFFIFRMIDTVTIPNFVGREMREAEVWPLSGGGQISIEHEYSLTHNEGVIAAQNREPETSMSRRSVLTVVVSRGPNMEEVIDLPDFYDMTRAQIRTWQEENRMRSVTFGEENHPEIEPNHVVRVEFSSTADPENFRRSDSVRIIVSTGPETVEIPNFVGDSPEELAEWMSENPQVEIEIEYEPHATIERGYVLRQSVDPRTRLALGETLTLTVSAGMPVEVPNFANMRMAEVKDMRDDPDADLNVDFRHIYHDSIPFGRFISQSVEAGEELYGENTTVTVTFSRGRPWISNRVGEPAQGLVQYFVELNDDGAFIRIYINEVNHHAPRGEIVSQSHFGQEVPLNQTIIFEISRGNLTLPTDPDMGMPPGEDN